MFVKPINIKGLIEFIQPLEMSQTLISCVDEKREVGAEC